MDLVDFQVYPYLLFNLSLFSFMKYLLSNMTGKSVTEKQQKMRTF